jgi:hypothetical protein
MKMKNLTVENPIPIGPFVVLPVSENTCSGEAIGESLLFHGSKSPVAVVVISASEERAFRITGEEVRRDALEEELPGLERMISETACPFKT